MVLAAPGLLLTPSPSSSPPKTPHRSYSAQTRSQNEEKTNPTPQTVSAPAEKNMNENGLSRVVFNNQSCRLCGTAHAAMTRIRMASDQDEEEEQVSGEWRRTRY